MGLYKIDILKPVDREIRKIDKQYIKRIINSIKSLAEEPFPPQSKKLKGAESSYRLRVGDYRILYEVNKKTKMIEIFHIRHRKDAYRNINI